MRTIDDYFREEPQGDLYHYTGIGSVLGMAKSLSVWASNAYYLNDSREVIHACDILTTTIQSRIQKGDGLKDEQHFLSQVAAWAKSFKSTHYGVFIFSLSEDKSVLSQWRSYTPHGKGVSLAFSRKTLDHFQNKSDLVLAKCIYDNDAQKEVINTLIDKLLQTFRQQRDAIDTTKEHPNNAYFKFLEEYRGDFLKVLCLIKHPSFSEEKEWRLISSYFASYAVQEIKFREGASMLVPYIEIPFPDTRPVFEEVVLGPSQYQNLSMSALNMFLSNQKLCRNVLNCTIPYRKW